MNTELHKRLGQLAFAKSRPFCYQDYMECPTGRCPKCGSDDLMRAVDGVGCEYRTDWIIRHILETELEAVDMEQAFEDSVRECYPEETKIGWMTFDTVTVMKEMDPVGWRCAFAEWESTESGEDYLVSFDNGGTYYRIEDVEGLLEAELT
jgi:hypothetical protein